LITGVSRNRWLKAQAHELDFWKCWRDAPAYAGFDVARFWTDQYSKLGAAADTFTGRHVVDIGCGPAGFVHFIPDAAARIRIDPLLAQYAQRLPLSEPQLSIAAAGEALPLASASMDVCLTFNVLDHMQDPRRALDEIFRILKPGGRLFVMTHTFPAWVLPVLWLDRLHPHHWTVGTLVGLISERFEIVHQHHERRHFESAWHNWKHAAGNLIVSSSYFAAKPRCASPFCGYSPKVTVIAPSRSVRSAGSLDLSGCPKGL
jgi:SAM-dependent methyltransferase